MGSRLWLNYTTSSIVIMENCSHGKWVTQSQTYKLISLVYYEQKDDFFLVEESRRVIKLKDKNKFVSVKHKNILLFNLLATSFCH